MRTRTFVEQFARDVRFSLRRLRKGPGFSAVAILVLALGLGANTSLFTVIDAVLLRPLQFPDPDRLVQLWESSPSRGELQNVISAHNFVDWQKQSGTIEQMAVYKYASFALIRSTFPERMPGILASSRFFDVFGVKPMLGRTLFEDDDRPGSHSVVLSFSSWRQRFNADPEIVGKSIRLNGELFTVIGVMPALFQYPSSTTEIWSAPAYDLKTTNRLSHNLFGVGRLKRDATLGEARAELSTIARHLEQQYPESNHGNTVSLIPLQDQLVGKYRPALFTLWGAVALVLLIGCANIAHLMLARSIARQKEFAIRAALGMSRWRLISQLLTESLILAGAGGLLGLVLSIWGTRLLIADGTRLVPRIEGVHLDSHVYAFTSLVSLFTVVLFGVLPAVRVAKIDLATSAKQVSSGALSGGAFRLRSILVVSELALSMILLIDAGLLIESLWRLENVDRGFATDNLLTMRISLSGSEYSTAIQRAAKYQEMIDRIQALPGITCVAASNDLPFSGSSSSTSFDIEGVSPSPGESRNADYRTVSSEYFRVLQTPIIAGRPFAAEDNRREIPAVTIINESLSRRFWPHANPIGHSLILSGKPHKIVGVVANVKHDNLAAPYGPEIYVTQFQGNAAPWTFLAIRSQTAVESLVPAVRDVVRDVAPAEPLYDVRTMQQRVAASIAPQRFTTLLLTTFAAFALLLAIIGLYGVVAFSVEQRRREVGIRMALGAQPRAICGLMVKQGLSLGIIGSALGVAGSLASERVFSSMLYGTQARDLAMLATVSVLFVAVTGIASYIPARRAAHLDPTTALRCE